MKIKLTIFPLLTLLMVAGCVATVDITKTAKGYRAPTDPNQVEIFGTRPERSFEELAEINVMHFAASDTAKLHNALRTKAAPVGANAVIITSRGIDSRGQLYATGIAVRWK